MPVHLSASLIVNLLVILYRCSITAARLRTRLQVSNGVARGDAVAAADDLQPAHGCPRARPHHPGPCGQNFRRPVDPEQHLAAAASKVQDKANGVGSLAGT